MIETYGILSVIPTIVLIGLALKTRKLLESILVASIIGFVVIYKEGFFLNWVDALYITFSSDLFVFIGILMACFGAFIKLLERSGGALAFGKAIKKYANTQRKSLFITYILGMIVFMDEYLNALVVTAATRSLNDQHKVPREMLALTVNTAGSPVCVLLPFSTWAAFYIGLIATQGVATELLTPAGIYISSIPYMFYPIVALIVTALLIWGKIPMMGPLKKAYERVEKTGNLLPDNATISNDEIVIEMEEEVSTNRISDFLVPMLAFVVAAIVTGNDIVMASLMAIFTCFVLYVGRRSMSVETFTETCIDGIKDFAYLIVLVLLILQCDPFRFQ